MTGEVHLTWNFDLVSFIETTGIIICVAVGAWLSYRQSKKLNDKFDKLNKKFDTLLENTKNLFAKTKAFSSAVTQEFPTVKDEFFQSTFERSSPVGLSELGEKVSKELNVQATVDSLLLTDLKRIPHDATVLDIQRICFDYAFHHLLEEVDNDIKQMIHRSIYNDGGDSENTLMVYGIVFRDTVFKERNIIG